MKPPALGLAVAFLTSLVSASLLAQGRLPSPDQPPPPSATLSGADTDLAPTKPERWFFGTAVDVGYAYIRPRLSVGYGQPFRRWFGLDVNPVVSTSAAGGYVGLRFENPFVDLRSGGLYNVSFSRSALPILPSYGRQESELRLGESAQYAAWDSELKLHVPVGPGTIISESEPMLLFLVPEDRNVFVESVRVITGGDWLYRQRLAYSFPTPGIEGLYAAVVAEVVHLPSRDTQVWRAGLTFRWWLFENLQIRVNLIPVVYGVDRLGLIGADLGQLGLRWLWSTH